MAENDDKGAATAPDPADLATESLTQTVAAMERMTRLFAETTTHAVNAMADPETQSPDRASDVTDPDPFHVASDAMEVWSRFATDPSRVAAAQVKLWNGFLDVWSAAARRVAPDADGSPAAAFAPPKGDKRWRDEEWTDNPVFDALKQTYLLISHWLVEMVDQVEDVDEDAKRKVRFFTRQLADAFSPTNFPMTNPAVLREAAKTGGESVLRGLRNLAEDLERGHGRIAIRQTDFAKFRVGENVATTPGEVIFENRIIQVIQYTPKTETVYATPLLIFPPWINKFYILDLRAENSMVSWLLEQGYQVFLVSWVNPTAELAAATFDDYMTEGIVAAVEATLKQTGQPHLNTVGYCIGGTLLASTLALMSQRKDTRIQSATFFAAQTDFSEPGDLAMFTEPGWMAEIERRMDANHGVLDGQTMADTFNMLRANDLVWSFFVQNYLMGHEPRAFDLLFWNADATRLPKALHLFYLQRFYVDNALSRGDLTMDGQRVALNQVQVPCYVQASKEDHIAPFRSVYRGAQGFGGDTRFVLAGSGHIAGVINHPAAKKYQHWVNDVAPLPPTAEAWFAGAVEQPGSWWPDWDQWLSARSGARMAPTPAAERPLKSIEPAPGRYVCAP